MRYGHTEIFVADPLAARDFYVDVLGFTLEQVQGDRFVWLKSGDGEFLLRPGRPSARGHTYRDAASALVLYTDDLGAAAVRLLEKGVVLRGADGADNCITFTDPDGNWFQLVNPADH